MSTATEQSLTAAHAEVKAEIARTDGKTSFLLAFVGAVLAGAWSVGHGMTLTRPALVVGVAGMGLLLAAAGLLLRSVRPNLGGGRGFPLWATLTPEQVTEALSQDLAADIAGLSRLAVGKFTCLRRAVDLTLTGGALLVLAALLTFGGAA
ncbi:Pycsar system effector family protein [Streptomyces olivochromogenes]|uniref:Pycsar system effector family protein n=1 Tax=Streptomyces olivochromogenes TaxID=1963 RepID=UPI001F35C053|nr:Pycsar system effector family protein [Streptomyces olivochromogenes]MCF3129845.1 integral membrane plasmid transfer protein [Streptomyces olivochromogenes]